MTPAGPPVPAPSTSCHVPGPPAASVPPSVRPSVPRSLLPAMASPAVGPGAGTRRVAPPTSTGESRPALGLERPAAYGAARLQGPANMTGAVYSAVRVGTGSPPPPGPGLSGVETLSPVPTPGRWPPQGRTALWEAFVDKPQPPGRSPADSETPGSGGRPSQGTRLPHPAPWFLCLDRVPVHRKQIAPWVWGTRGAFDKGTQVWAELRSLWGWRPEVGEGKVCPAQPPGSAGAGVG